MVWLNKKSLGISLVIPVVVYLSLLFLGGLREFEYNLYDWYLKLRSTESIDSRIVIVGITEKDLEKLGQTTLDDGTLARVIQKIKTKHPWVIGLDMHRNIPVCFVAEECQIDQEELAALFRDTPNLIGIEKTQGGNAQEKAILPHPELAKANRTGDSAIIKDSDFRVRRTYFYLTNSEGKNSYSFGLKVALKYLEKENISLVVEGTQLKLNNRVFPKIESTEIKSTRIFQKFNKFYSFDDIDGHQILLNYRHNKNPFQQITISQLLEDDFSEVELREKIVLIGAVYELSKDFFSVPYFDPGESSEDLFFGVEIHAQLVSYLLNAALEERTILKFLPSWIENILVIFLLLESCMLIFLLDKKKAKIFYLLILVSVQTVLILFASWLTFSWGYWIPGANLVFITFVNLAVLSCLIYHNYQREEKSRLENQVKEKTQELQKALDDLKKITREVIKQEKLDFFLASTAFLDHEIKNPLGLILVCSDTVTVQADSLIEYLEEAPYREDLFQDIQDIIAEIITNNTSIREQAHRINSLLKLIDTQSYQKQEDLSPQNIGDLITKVWSVAWYTFTKMTTSQLEVELIQKKHETLDKINIYPKSLEVALVNILNNSLYSLLQKKQETDSSLAFQAQIKIKTENYQEHLVITIEDNGVGIAQKNYQEIFKEFYSTKENSLGLGLFITKQIIEARHHGSIDVESELGSFTRFILKIPVNLR